MAARQVDCFADVAAGLEDLAAVELVELGARAVAPGVGGLRFQHARPGDLTAAGLLAAVYRELRFAVARPKALLGDAALRTLVGTVAQAAAGVTPAMTRFRLSAAGSDTPVFRRLAAAIQTATGLREDDDGELLVRVRPFRGAPGAAQAGSTGWEALVRLTPRPLSTRGWRVCNRPGGLNATVAVALNELLAAHARPGGGAYLNLMCGSGTLLVERALAGPSDRLVGVDVDRGAVDCSAANLAAAGVAGRVELIVGDVCDGGLAERLAALVGVSSAPRGGLGVFDAVAADAPWGDAVGKHADNERLHAAVTSLAGSLLAPGGRFGLVSHEVRLVARTVERDPAWRVVSRRQVAHGGHNPVMLVLERAARS